MKILKVLARAEGVTADPQALGTDMSWGVGRRAGGWGFNPPTTQTLGTAIKLYLSLFLHSLISARTNN